MDQTSFRDRPVDLTFEVGKEMGLQLEALVERVAADFEVSHWEVGAEETAAVVKHSDFVSAWHWVVVVEQGSI